MSAAERSVTADRHRSSVRRSKIAQQKIRSRNAVSAGGGPRSNRSFFSTSARSKKGAKDKGGVKDEAVLLPIEWRCQMPSQRHDEVHAAVLRSRRALESADRVSRAIKAVEENFFSNSEDKVTSQMDNPTQNAWRADAITKHDRNGVSSTSNVFGASLSRPGTGAFPTSDAFPSVDFPMTGLPNCESTTLNEANKSTAYAPEPVKKKNAKSSRELTPAPRTNSHARPIPHSNSGTKSRNKHQKEFNQRILQDQLEKQRNKWALQLQQMDGQTSGQPSFLPDTMTAFQQQTIDLKQKPPRFMPNPKRAPSGESLSPPINYAKGKNPKQSYGRSQLKQQSPVYSTQSVQREQVTKIAKKAQPPTQAKDLAKGRSPQHRNTQNSNSPRVQKYHMKSSGKSVGKTVHKPTISARKSGHKQTTSDSANGAPPLPRRSSAVSDGAHIVTAAELRSHSQSNKKALKSRRRANKRLASKKH